MRITTTLSAALLASGIALTPASAAAPGTPDGRTQATMRPHLCPPHKVWNLHLRRCVPLKVARCPKGMHYDHKLATCVLRD
ncbi:hypothetical protein [Actinomadura rupiterrae]|uniref:hypothetical protein n=1 Tax=Actinomadura rupiterrae TaxID=559627 RepID=UPI0020A56B99|nr:hypothetical protein [Actinomadura rupiterrae]MCP2340746.1 hypothetical protein [Actinomadura rupiterrae]